MRLMNRSASTIPKEAEGAEMPFTRISASLIIVRKVVIDRVHDGKFGYEAGLLEKLAVRQWRMRYNMDRVLGLEPESIESLSPRDDLLGLRDVNCRQIAPR